MNQIISMVAIITADIIDSRAIKVQKWMPELKKTLRFYGKEPQSWEIFRGDSLQLEIAPIKALEAAIHLKASIKQFKEIDIRIAIGIGEKDYEGDSITNSNGSAFENSGSCFDQLKKQTLGIKTPWQDSNKTLNLLFDLASLSMNKWTANAAFVIKTLIEKGMDINQKELAAIVGKSQGNISDTLTRAAFEEIQKLMNYYKDEIQSRC